MDKLLANKTALVTGGSRGIGEAICKTLTAYGANVAFTYMSSEDKALAVETALKAAGVKAKAYKSDAASYSESEKLITDVVAEFGSLDIIVNNAGITRDTLLLRMTEQQWDDVITTNLKSVFNITKHASRIMLKQRSGSIINMSSIVGIIGNAGQGNYSASKAGIIGFTKSMAKELASRNIRVNAIAPGFIESDMTHAISEEMKKQFMSNIPLGRYGKAEDVADTVVFLASDMSRYITGQVISVCGGLTM